MKLSKTKLREIIREELSQLMESNSVDSKYFMRQMKYFIEEAELPEERKFLQDITDFVNQKHLDGDISKVDIQRLAKRSRFYDKVDAEMLIDYVWEQIVVY